MSEIINENNAAAFQDLVDTEQLAKKTGVAYDYRHGVYGDDAKIGLEELDETVVSGDREHVGKLGDYGPHIITGNAEFSTHDGIIKRVLTQEPTGTYEAAVSITGRNGDVVVQRPDGNGAEYTQLFDANSPNAQKASAIIASRAAREVRKTIINRTVEIADELKKEQN
ncbi:hypothetical protein BH23PAT2_BH23PAT2_09360 [soil metagenome]